MGYYMTIEECKLNGSLEDLDIDEVWKEDKDCLLYTSPSPRDS